MEQTDEKALLNAALLLMRLSNCTCNPCWKNESNLDEPAPLKEKKCISETTARGSSRKRKSPTGEMHEKSRKKMKAGSHMCFICKKSFATGPQLGGHMRAHYDDKKSAESSVKCWLIRKCVESELRFYITIRKNDK